MNLLFILSIVALLLIAAYAFTSTKARRVVRQFANGLLVTVTPFGKATYVGDVQFTSRFLLCKIGSDYAHIAIAGVGDQPLGVVTDQCPTGDIATGDLSYPYPVQILGVQDATQRMIASAAIALGALVVSAANGQIQTLPIHGGGSAWVVGRAITAAANAGDQVEVVPTLPYIVTIPA